MKTVTLPVAAGSRGKNLKEREGKPTYLVPRDEKGVNLLVCAIEHQIPETVDEMVQVYGGVLVYEHALHNLNVACQQAGRPALETAYCEALDAGLNETEALDAARDAGRAAMLAWVPGETKRTRKTPEAKTADARRDAEIRLRASRPTWSDEQVADWLDVVFP